MMNSGRLYIVPTPIGNLSDITIRAINILKNCDLVIAEDTRITRNLLKHYQIKTNIISYHKFNEVKRTDFVLKLLMDGKNISLVSNAGTPLISDPGFVIIDKAIRHGIKIEVLPGPSSVLPAILLSGFNPERFFFYGFLNKKNSIRKDEISWIGKMPYPVIIFESPLRIIRLLDEFLEIIGDREIAVVKELTKIYENIFRGKISEIKPQLNENNLKGEFIVILGPYKELPETTDYDSVIKRVNYYLKTGKTKKEIVSLISNEFGLKRNEAYKIIHDKMEV